MKLRQCLSLVVLSAVVFAGRAQPAERTVLLEFFSNYAALPCAPAAATSYDFIDSRLDVVGVEYHTFWPSVSDPFYQANPSEQSFWINYYMVFIVPTVRMDGEFTVQDPQVPNSYHTLYQSRLGDPSQAVIQLGGYYDPRDRTGTLIGRAISEGPGSYQLRLVVTQDDAILDPPGPNGQSVFRHIFRKFLPDPSGWLLTFEAPYPDTLIVSTDFSLIPAWSPPGITFVAWLQDQSSPRVEQSTELHLLDLPVSVAPTSWGGIKQMFAR